ncbi:PASTA domain-containing protein [Streptomyces sp. NPDC023588]|uniref:PASTA domain-containing protein n=1 Tax=Streptomyces sp. NPDC023588 TaxID=3154907 RepID=UPI0033D6966B
MYPPPHSFVPQQSIRRWWQHPALIIAALVVFPPAGITLVWLSRWNQTKKIIATVVAGLWFLALVLSDPPKETTDAAKPQAAVSVAPTPSVSASATPAAPPTPTPTPDPVMPSVVGKPFAEAEKTVEDVIDTEVTALSTYRDVTLPADYAQWIVCFQDPRAGLRIVAKSAQVNVHLVAAGTQCPAKKGGLLHPAPEPTQDNDDSGSSSTSSSGGSGGGSGSSGGSVGSVHPGAFCSPGGATGTSNGRVYTCKGPGQNRWRQ